MDVIHQPPASSIGPDRIRQLRGARSRAAFARLLGVTPQTIYRWELPDGAPEARRPRAPEQAKLLALESGSSIETTASPARPAALALPPARPVGDELVALPVIARMLSGERERGERELRALLASASLSEPARTLATAGQALLDVLWRGDGRAALAALSRSTLEPGTLSTRARGVVLAATALVHSAHDARLFDLGRVQAGVAQLEELSATEPESWLLGAMASMLAALVVGDVTLLRRAFRRLDERPVGELPAVLALLRDEARALELLFAGQSAAAVQRFEQVLARARALGFAPTEARMLATLAQRRLDELAPPEQALALAQRARQVAEQGQLHPGPHSLMIVRSATEALIRLGRFDEAERELAEADAYREQTGLEAAALSSIQARYAFLRGRLDPIRTLRERLEQPTLPDLVAMHRPHVAFLAAMEQMHTSAPGQPLVAAFERAEEEATRWPFLLRDVVSHGIVARIITGRLHEARLVLRRAQRCLDQAPSPWVEAQVRRFEGLLLVAEGDWVAGRRQLALATATFELAQARPDVMLARYARLLFGKASGEAIDEAQLREAQEELAQLGVDPPVGMKRGVALIEQQRATTATSSPRTGALGALVVPFQRLAVRGMSAPVLLRELLAVVRELWPGRACGLEEFDARGEGRLLEGPAPGPLASWAEFGDGAGRRLRVGVAGPLDAEGRAALELLATAVGLALEVTTVRGHGVLPAQADEVSDVPGLVAVSAPMRRLRDDLVRLAASRSTVILTGESGSGKEVIASVLHRLSPRAARPYVTFNCAAVPRDLFEDQLFGHKKGAFTSADRDQPGLIRAAEGGTIFLDEIGELPLEVQPKLLRFLEDGEVRPLGASRAQKVDVRILAATHRDLAEMVRTGAFREDLYYRLQVVPVRVPPLRERRDDILPLARFFLRQLTDGAPPPLAPDAQAALLSHAWPGNVRELRNLLERTMAYAGPGEVLGAAQLRW